MAADMTLDAWTALLWLTGEVVLNPRDEHPTLPDAAGFAALWHRYAHTLQQMGQFEAMRRRFGVADGMEDRFDAGIANAVRVLADALNDLAKAGVDVLPQVPRDVLETARRLGIDLPGQEA